MEVLYPRCAALDVHKDTVVAAIRLAEGREVQSEVRTFATTTPALLDLSRLARRAWLHPRCHGGHRHLLAPGLAGARRDSRTLILANPAHVKNVPGRKPMWPTRSGSPTCSPTA